MGTRPQAGTEGTGRSITDMERHRPYAETIPKKADERELHDLQVELDRRARDEMLLRTGHEDASWTAINSNDKRRARLGAIHHVLSSIPYRHRRDDVVGPPDDHVVVPAAVAMQRDWAS